VTILLTLLDLAAILASAIAAWLWWRASRSRAHRMTIHDDFDYHDINRLVVAFNRAAIRNENAALASALAAAIVAVVLAVSHWIG
jgi:hypothetical protein